MMTRAPVVIVVATRQRVNPLLRSGLFALLRARGYPIVIVSPFMHDETFRNEFAGTGVQFEPLSKLTRDALLITSLRNEALEWQNPFLQKAHRIKRQMTRRFAPSPVRVLLGKFVRATLLALIPSDRKKSVAFWDTLMITTGAGRTARSLLSRHNPCVVLVGTTGAEGRDIPFVLAAKNLHIPAVALDHNLDAPAYRYFAPPWGNAHYACFGEHECAEFHNLQQIPLERLHTVGTLRLDKHLSDPTYPSRIAFLRTIGADPSKELILFTALDHRKFPFNADIIQTLSEAIKKGTFGNAELYVRFDKGHDLGIYPAELLSSLKFERAEEKHDPAHLMNLVHHASAYAGAGATTLALEAIALGTPAVWIGFDGSKTVDPSESVAAQYELPCYQRAIATGGLPLARSPQELVQVLSSFLRDPEAGKEQRLLAARQEYANVLGESASERIFSLIETITV